MVQFSLEAVVLSVPDNIRTGSEAHTALYSEDTGSSPRGVKRYRRKSDLNGGHWDSVGMVGCSEMDAHSLVFHVLW